MTMAIALKRFLSLLRIIRRLSIECRCSFSLVFEYLWKWNMITAYIIRMLKRMDKSCHNKGR